jgi:hypothetical protein
MTTIEDYRRTAETTHNAVVLADVADHSTIAIFGQNLGFIHGTFRDLTLEKERDLPLFWLTINGVAYAYEDETIATEDLDAILTGAFPVHLRGIGDDDQLDALLERYQGSSMKRVDADQSPSEESAV